MDAEIPDGAEPYFIRALFRSRVFPRRQLLIAWKIEYQPHSRDWKLFHWMEGEERWTLCTRACLHPATAAAAVSKGETDAILWDEAEYYDAGQLALEMWDRTVPESYQQRV